MGHKIGSKQRFKHLQAKAISHLLPDTARFYPPLRTATASGSYRDTDDTPALYKGLPDVPVRLDVSKHYRPEQIAGAEATVNDFELHVPWDFPLAADQKIVIANERYEVRKLLDTNSFLVTKVALVARVDVGKRS